MLKRSKKRYLKKSLKKFHKKSHKGGVGKSRTQKAKDMLWNKRGKNYKKTVKGVGVLAGMMGTLYVGNKMINNKKKNVMTHEGIEIININKKICDQNSDKIKKEHNKIMKIVGDGKDNYIREHNIVQIIHADVFIREFLNEYNIKNNKNIVQIIPDEECNDLEELKYGYFAYKNTVDNYKAQ
jgi:hypothetical protein